MTMPASPACSYSTRCRNPFQRRLEKLVYLPLQTLRRRFGVAGDRRDRTAAEARVGFGGAAYQGPGNWGHGQTPRRKRMNDQQLDRNLRSIGKECFVTFFEQFCDWSLSNADVAAQIKKRRGYTDKACLSRTSHSRSIIKAGRSIDALEIVRQSTSTQVTAHTKDKAAALAALFRESGLKRSD